MCHPAWSPTKLVDRKVTVRQSYDVAVLGLGGMGSAAAYHLARRGVRVVGFDRYGVAHANGSSHGASRIIRQSYFEHPAYVPLLVRAYELWHQLEHDSGRRIVTLTGGLYIGSSTSDVVTGSRRAAAQWGLPHELLDAAEVRSRFPTLSPAADEYALYEQNAGFVEPEAAVAAHAELASRAGADLHFEEPIVAWESDGADGGVRITTARTRYEAASLVICPGPWAPDVVTGLGIPLVVERQVMYWFRPRGDLARFHPDRHPVYIWEDAAGEQFYGFPAQGRPEDHGVKVAFFRAGEPCSPETIDRDVHADEVERMRAHLATRIPDLPGDLLAAKTCMYTTTPDHHFVVGAHPEYAHVVIACGFSGHGFKFVPVVGEILADLATTGRTAHPIGLFDPRRFRDGQPAASR